MKSINGLHSRTRIIAVVGVFCIGAMWIAHHLFVQDSPFAFDLTDKTNCGAQFIGFLPNDHFVFQCRDGQMQYLSSDGYLIDQETDTQQRLIVAANALSTHSGDNKTRLIDIVSRETVATFDRKLIFAEASRMGRYHYGTTRDELHIWDSETDSIRSVKLDHGNLWSLGALNTFSLSPNAEYAAGSGTEGVAGTANVISPLYVWDTHSGEILHKLHLDGFPNPDPLWFMNEQQIALGNGNKTEILIFDLEQGSITHTLDSSNDYPSSGPPSPDDMNNIVLTPDDRFLIAKTFDEILIWNTATWEIIYRGSGKGLDVRHRITINPSGTSILAFEWDLDGHLSWDVYRLPNFVTSNTR